MNGVFLVKGVVSKLRLSGIDRSLGRSCMDSVHTTLAQASIVYQTKLSVGTNGA